MKHWIFVTVIGFGCASIATISQAMVVAEYTFEGTGGTGNGNSSDTDLNTVASVYSFQYFPADNPPTPRPTGFVDFVNNPGFSLPSFAATSSFDRDSDPSFSDGLSTIDFDIQTHFQQFSLTVPDGVLLSLNSIHFEWGVMEAVNSNGASPTLDLVSSATGSTTLQSDSFSIPVGSSGLLNADGTSGLKSYEVDLSAQSDLQNLTDTTLTFIFALDENQNKESDNRRHVIDNVILNGTVGTGIIPGDVDGNNIVDELDYFIIRDNLFEATIAGIPVTRADGDLVTDGIVDLFDFRAWKDVASATALAAAGIAIPEPNTAILFFSASLGITCVRRRNNRWGSVRNFSNFGLRDD